MLHMRGTIEEESRKTGLEPAVDRAEHVKLQSVHDECPPPATTAGPFFTKQLPNCSIEGSERQAVSKHEHHELEVVGLGQWNTLVRIFQNVLLNEIKIRF